jgi:hypothetical protein
MDILLMKNQQLTTTEFLERVKVRTPNTGLRRGGLTCKLGALCFYSSSVLADSFVLEARSNAKSKPLADIL